MRTIQDIYEEYKIMPNLQLHMLRVGAIGSIICDNCTEPLDKENIVLAGLLHDMGNILKFKLDLFPEFLEPEGLSYWQKVKEEYGKKYGDDEYLATLKIIEELGMPERIFELVSMVSFLDAPATAASDDLAGKIVEYGDSRVTPFGVGSMEERFADLRKRYAHRGTDTPERLAYEEAVRTMERKIFAKCSIAPEDITDETIAPLIPGLRNFVIK